MLVGAQSSYWLSCCICSRYSRSYKLSNNNWYHLRVCGYDLQTLLSISQRKQIQTTYIRQIFIFTEFCFVSMLIGVKPFNRQSVVRSKFVLAAMKMMYIPVLMSVTLHRRCCFAVWIWDRDFHLESRWTLQLLSAQ